MAKLNLDEISNISGAESTAIGNINGNSAKIEAAIENTLSRDGTSPNTMGADLDMNSNDILNVGTLNAADISIAGEDTTGFLERIDQAVQDAEQSATDAQTAETNAETAQAASEAALADFNEKYLGAYVDDATATAAAGGSPILGALYWNTTNNILRAWNGSAWETNLTITDGSIIEAKYATGSVSTRVMADGAATLAKIGDDAKADFRLVDPSSPRNKLQYASATTVRIYGKFFPMGGCRVFGQYFKARVPIFETSTFYTTVSTVNDLAFGTTVQLENWHAVFALANDGDSAPVFKVSPYLYVKSRDASDVLTLGKCGEQQGVGAGTIDDATYSWANDELVGAEVLVISDRPTSNTDAGFAPRMTTVTANTATTITLADVGEVRDKCMLLLVPKGYDYDRYCASFYVDTAEIRNIYDFGGKVVSHMVNLAFYHENDGSTVSTWLNGAISSGASSKKMDCARFISPLATAIVIQERCSLATTSAVETASFMDPDGSNHYVGVHRQSKASGSSGPEVTSYSSIFEIGFLRGQNYRNWNSGGGASSRYDVQHLINGWVEP